MHWFETELLTKEENLIGLMALNRETVGQAESFDSSSRPGNVHSVEDWDELLLPEVEGQQAEGKELAFRADAAFAKPEIYEALEKRGVKYAIRIPANENLERDIAELLTRPVGRPRYKPVVRYKAFSTKRPVGRWRGE